MSQSIQYDVKKDYYKILGVKFNATLEEIKVAHVRLALKYHPDTQSQNKTTDETAFLEISEAWSVLSKPDTKLLYDQDRLKMGLIHSPVTSMGGFKGFGDQAGVGSFRVQRDNYHNNVQRHASSSWKDLQDKYKDERWLNLPLNRRKSSRRQDVTPLSVIVGKGAFKVGLCICFAYALYHEARYS